MQQALRSFGHEVETIHGLPRGEARALRYRRRLATSRSDRIERLRRLVERVTPQSDPSIDIHVCPAQRQVAIAEFASSRIQSAAQDYPDLITRGDLKSRYDFFVAGSDQIWNPAFTHGNLEWFLNFAEPEQRVAYAASFGVPSIPGYLTRRYRRGLVGIKSLSVREHQGAEIVRAITGTAPPVVLDPTMLLEASEWQEHATVREPFVGSDYVLVFMLSAGDLGGSRHATLGVGATYARDRGLELVDISYPSDPSLLSMSPLDFVGALRNAQLVLTDSFHAALFSILFNTPFLIADRGVMGSRLETLLDHAGIGGVALSRDGEFGQSPAIDWPGANERIRARRLHSLGFLDLALSAP